MGYIGLSENLDSKLAIFNGRDDHPLDFAWDQKNLKHTTPMCSIAVAGFEVAFAIAGSPPFLDKQILIGL